MKRILELRAAEGGLDAKLFVADMAETYIKLATRKG
jgi:protein subunit release factor A